MDIHYQLMNEGVVWRTWWRKCNPLEWHFMYTV